MRHTRGVATGEMSDSELLAAHVSGDSRAFTELVQRHRRYLWRIAKRTSYSADDAADALQDALLSAHRMAGTYRADAAVRSWLHRIVVNACLDRIRRNRVRATVPLDDELSAHIRRRDDPIGELELTLDIEAALFQLPPEQRAAIVAVDVEGFSVAEAATRLGVPVGTIKSRCARARLKLAQSLNYLRMEGNQAVSQIVYP
ncbi:RNA polymerase sigma factor SigM [Hoyosella sp. YIM 151337]|nr:RNA polymerase sigma factor SigM [Hoyosella sp. YIM 151337]MCW4354804.1 RNA polymerase sigma factor SigM [Hoyosella sp. YIM 151337]